MRRAALAVALLLTLGAGAAFGASPWPNQTLPYGEVNWDKGFIRVSAVGLPPLGVPAGPASGDKARQNAVSTAQKRLLAIILELPAKQGKVRDQLTRRPEAKARLRAIVTGADIRGKSYSDGSVEVTLMINTADLRALLGDW